MNDIVRYIGAAKLAQIIHDLRAHDALAKANKNPVEFFEQFGIPLPANIAYEIHLNTVECEYFILPIDATMQLTENELQTIIAAVDAPKKDCVSSASTFSTIMTLSTAESVLCAGTVLSSAGTSSSLSSASSLTTASTASCAKQK